MAKLRLSARPSAPVALTFLCCWAVAGTCQAQELNPGPFDVLEWTGGVTTSRDGKSVWASAPGRELEAQLPGHRTPVLRSDEARQPSLGLHCRIKDALSDEDRGHAHIVLDDHPEQRDAHMVFSVAYWVLGILGDDVERWPVLVSLDGAEAFAGEMERRLATYSFPRPGLTITLPVAMVAERIARSADPVSVIVTGDGIRVAADFSPTEHVRMAVRLMQEHCSLD